MLSPLTSPTPHRALMFDIELTEPIPAITAADAASARHVWVLARRYTEPVGVVLLDLEPTGLTSTGFADAIHRELAVTGAAQGTVDYLARRAEVLAQAPEITVVICTRDRAHSLSLSLDSVLAQRYPRYRVLVVDNAPHDDSTKAVVTRFAGTGATGATGTGQPVDLEYVVEPRPGLSRARNAALRAAPGELLAYLDDDAIADPHWLAEIARGFADVSSADAVSGSIVAAELETAAQLWFEQYGGHSKGRGFTRAVFSPHTAHVQHPLYPLPPFGAGGNMAFRPGVIDAFGGFDEALGAGTPAMGSEDTHAFMSILYGGGTVVYQPSALVRHYSRRDFDGLRRQMHGYGKGLTAAYTSMVLARPRTLGALLRLAPTAARDMLSRNGLRTGGLQADFPRELLTDNRGGMLRGPAAYLRGRRALRSPGSGLGRGGP